MLTGSCYHARDTMATRFTMKSILSTLLFGLLLLSNNLLAEKSSPVTEVTLYPSTGVRFVICTVNDQKLPSPLFTRFQEKYVPLFMSTRAPSERALPESDGHIRLYDSKPEDAKNPGNPFLDITVPEEMRKGRVLCIVVLVAENAKPQLYYMHESDFPVGGFYVLNFSPSPLELLVTTKDELPEKGIMIAPYSRPANGCFSPSTSNIWSFRGKENPEVKSLLYMLRVPSETEESDAIPLRSAKFTPNKSQATLCIVVKHPKIEQAFRLLSIQYNNEADKRNSAAQNGGQNSSLRGSARSSISTNPR